MKKRIGILLVASLFLLTACGERKRMWKRNKKEKQRLQKLRPLS